MKAILNQIKARPHLLASTVVGALVMVLTPSEHVVTRLLVGWNAAVWLYLAQAFWVMSHGDHHHLRRTAIAQAEGAGAVLAAVTAAVLASMAAIALELAAVKGASASHALPHVAFALVTVAGAWLLLPTLFALSYASLFYRSPQGHGLQFPAASADDPPDYWDFLYFSFTIAVALQTADVALCSTPMRRLVLLQSVLSFVFNTAILALAVNIAASLV
ncbi:MAG: DUF1345 domain-containing protein [Cytophagales bacterium]|nr:DUF1345 domain-containing protein [Rhizobacter sp.]